MIELKELQAFLTALIAKTPLEDRKTEVEVKIVSGVEEFSVTMYKEFESYSEEFKAKDSTLDRCKKRLKFEVEMLLSR